MNTEEQHIVKAVTARLTGEFYVGQRIKTPLANGVPAIGTIVAVERRTIWIRWNLNPTAAPFGFSRREMKQQLAGRKWVLL